MPLNIVLELSDEDLAYFANVMDSVWKKNSKRPVHELIEGAQRLITKARKAKAPAYVTKRLADISLLIDLLGDEEWPLETEDRRRIAAVVGYFAVSKDMIPDKIPGIGYLDDALVAEIVIRELRHDIEGYRDFCIYRDQAKAGGHQFDREQWLTSKRRQLLDRISRRRERMWSRTREESPTPAILRYSY